MRPRILLADDHEIVRTGIKAHLDGQWEICAEADNGQQAVEKALALQPDLILMDISMPVLNGIEAIRQIRQLKIPTKVIILTMHDSEEVMKRGRQIGADACLTKTCGAAELLETIVAVLRNR